MMLDEGRVNVGSNWKKATQQSSPNDVFRNVFLPHAGHLTLDARYSWVC